MRVLVFHGYLLRGTGSNVYNANLAAALVRLGHEVHLLAQERVPEELPFVDAIGDWDAGTLTVRVLREPVRCTVYRPALAGVLPVYVADRYEGIAARPFIELTDSEIATYVDANVRAVRDVVARAAPDIALANHVVMGPLVLARGIGRTPYAVKVHGSALEYVVARQPERFLDAARNGLGGARGVLVGSRHTAERLWNLLGEPDLPARTRLSPPGVDVARFAPHEPARARARLAALSERLAARAGETGPAARASAFGRDEAAAARALRQLADARPADPFVAYVGKLLVAKGVDLLLAAWPLVLARHPGARLVIVGFGTFRDGLERLLGALANGDLAAVAALAAQRGAADGGERAPLAQPLAFLAHLDADREARERYLAAAARLRERVVFTGRLDHDELADVLPACTAQVVPSRFAEAFGMVAVEAAACGTLPICADHSGLAEVAAVLASAVPEPAREWLAFPADPDAVRSIARRVCAWLEADRDVRARTRMALVGTARERWSWDGVARDVIAAARGHLDELPPPRRPVRG